MKSSPWHWLKAYSSLLAPPRPEPTRQAELIVAVQRRIVLPVKAGVIVMVLHFFFSSSGLSPIPDTETVVLQTLRGFFPVYIAANIIGGVIFFTWKRFPAGLFQWLVFILGLLDGLFVAGLMLITGATSIAFWLFPVLIVLNAISIPLAMPQIVLNLLLSGFYAGAAVLSGDLGPGQIPPAYVPGLSPTHIGGETNTVPGHLHTSHKAIVWNSTPPPPPEETPPAESVLSNLFVLLLLTLCCYGVQALAERQRRELEEAREFAVRESQLHSAGRLAAEFAHQIKNPLAVINNAAFSLQRSLRENKNSAAQQIEIIQEEVARADRVITQIMGYAQLSEGRVEKLDVLEELQGAIAQVFPPAMPTEIKIHCRYDDYFPPLLMQRVHLSEVLVNLLKNAREAVGRSGNIFVTARRPEDEMIEISIRDDGCGIPPDRIEQIFEAYYTSKNGGSGMGLAIVRHNVELYGGRVRAKSQAGNGAEFIITFPAKAIVHQGK